MGKSSGGKVGDEDEGGRETGEIGVEGDSGERMRGGTTGGEEVGMVRN